jgi:hypothetical protein
MSASLLKIFEMEKCMLLCVHSTVQKVTIVSMGNAFHCLNINRKKVEKKASWDLAPIKFENIERKMSKI